MPCRGGSRPRSTVRERNGATMPSANLSGGSRISLADAHDHALARLRSHLDKEQIEDSLVDAFVHRDIAVPGWYRIEDGETVFGTELQAQFWSGIRRGDYVNWASNECHYTIVYDEVDKITDSFAYELQVHRDQLETWITAQERHAFRGETPKHRAQNAANARKAKEDEPILRNRIQSVIAAARALGNRPHRDIAKRLVGTPKGQGFSSETIRKILAGKYPPQKELGIPGLQ